MATASGVEKLMIPCWLCSREGRAGLARMKCMESKTREEIWVGGCSEDECPAILWGVADAKLVGKRDAAVQEVEAEMKKEIADARAGKNLGLIAPSKGG